MRIGAGSVVIKERIELPSIGMEIFKELLKYLKGTADWKAVETRTQQSSTIYYLPFIKQFVTVCR